jgi:hypothetical protein
VDHENRSVDIASISVLISVDVLTAHGTILCSYCNKCRKYDVRFLMHIPAFYILVIHIYK